MLCQALLMTGAGLALVGGLRWAEAGFPFSFAETVSVLGGRHWHIQKDSHFYLMTLGTLMAGYAAIELRIRRWDKK